MCPNDDKMATKILSIYSAKSPQIPVIYDNPIVPHVIPTLIVLD